MHVLRVLATLVTVQCATTLDYFNAYVNDKFLYPKCCKQGFHLNSTKSTISCIKGGYLKLQVPSKYNESGDKCVDLLLEKSTYNLIIFDRNTQQYNGILSHITTYPKCCPLGFTYDNMQHRCVFGSERTLDDVDGLFIASGMSECRSSNKAVIDFSYNNENITIQTNLSIHFKGITYNYGKYCFDINATGENIVRVCDNYNDVCKSTFEDDKIPCFKKCCPDGEIYIKTTCVPTFDSGISLNDPLRIKWKNNTWNFGVLQAETQRKYLALPNHKFYIDASGNMHVREDGDWVSYTSKDAIYCIETHRTGTISSQKFFLMFHAPSEQTKFNIKGTFMILSIFFICATLLIYLVLPEMHNLYGKSLMMYFVALIISYGWLVYGQLYDQSAAICLITGFIIMYFMLAYFTWLNVICFDMWFTFGQMRVLNPLNKSNETRRFIYYNLYGWGIPTICTLLAFTMYKVKYLPDYLRPHIGTVKCFFEKPPGTYDYLIYFLLPITCLIVTNCIFFIKTILYCFDVKDQINRMKDTTNEEKSKRTKDLNKDREKLSMSLKLGVVMGVSWLFEVLSSLVSFRDDPILEVIEYIWDSFNCLTGVFIFCIFIMKKKVFKSLKNKVSHNLGRRLSQSSTTITSAYSNSIHTDALKGKKIES